MSANDNDDFLKQLRAILRQPQIEPDHPHHAQAAAAVKAEIDRMNAGGATLTGQLARINENELPLTPLATRYAALVLDLLAAERVAVGRSDLHAAVGHLALQAAVGRISADAIAPDDRPQ